MAAILTSNLKSTDPFLMFFTTEFTWKSLNEEKPNALASSIRKRDEALIA
jgi:hypothetical protein